MRSSLGRELQEWPVFPNIKHFNKFWTEFVKLFQHLFHAFFFKEMSYDMQRKQKKSNFLSTYGSRTVVLLDFRPWDYFSF